MKRWRSFAKSMDREEEYSGSIPFDLVIEILTRLPSKSIARLRCVSKLWDYTIRGPNFSESFFNISSSRPKLMFTCLKEDKTFFFTSPTPPQHSSSLAANLQISFPINFPIHTCRPIHGLLCGVSHQRTLKGKNIYVTLICNPSTGQTLTLPIVENSTDVIKSCLGYDPVNKQCKVLCITISYDGSSYSIKYQVITLGTGEKLSWRMIECNFQYYPYPVDSRDIFHSVYDEICINGVCYYFGKMHIDNEIHVIVCFDIRYEKFKFIRQAQGMSVSIRELQSTLVNHKDTLAKLQLNMVDGRYTGILLWVLKDAEEHEWLKYSYDFLPRLGSNIVEENKLRCVGVTATDEIVLSTKKDESGSFYLLYYNTESKTIKRVEIQGMKAYKTCKTYTFLDHVEDVKLMSSD